MPLCVLDARGSTIYLCCFCELPGRRGKLTRQWGLPCQALPGTARHRGADASPEHRGSWSGGRGPGFIEMDRPEQIRRTIRKLQQYTTVGTYLGRYLGTIKYLPKYIVRNDYSRSTQLLGINVN